MIILSIRTDKPEAEIGLFNNGQQLVYETWQAHRQLAETLHQKITGLLNGQGKQLADVQAIVCYKGPGSFTGLRIGLSVANALAYSLGIPIVGIEGENEWLEKGIARLLSGDMGDNAVMPEYGAPVHITPQRH